MARHLRIVFPGAIYHVSCRMVGPWKDGDAFLFKDDSDRLRLLCTYGAQTQRQVATHLGLSTGAAISIQPSGTFAGCGKMPLTSILRAPGPWLRDPGSASSLVAKSPFKNSLYG